MRRRLVLVAIAAVSLLAIGASPSFASSHREAPLIAADPEADLTDLYAYRDFTHPSKVNFILTAVPLEEPGGAPNYYKFGDNVRYDINIDRNGDARPDITYRFRFATHVRNGDVFVYNFPGKSDHEPERRGSQRLSDVRRDSSHLHLDRRSQVQQRGREKRADGAQQRRCGLDPELPEPGRSRSEVVQLRQQQGLDGTGGRPVLPRPGRDR